MCYCRGKPSTTVAPSAPCAAFLTLTSPSLLPRRLVAWGEDTSGNEKYTLRVRDIATGGLC